jgi:hypothetical protein
LWEAITLQEEFSEMFVLSATLFVVVAALGFAFFESVKPAPAAAFVTKRGYTVWE